MPQHVGVGCEVQFYAAPDEEHQHRRRGARARAWHVRCMAVVPQARRNAPIVLFARPPRLRNYGENIKN